MNAWSLSLTAKSQTAFQNAARLQLAERREAMLRVERESRELQRQRELEAEQASATVQGYGLDPESYATNVLKVQWWAKQKEIAQSVVRNPRTFVQASHNVGKTFLVGGLVNWRMDCFVPSITKTTAPTKEQVQRLTWKEVRAQRHGRDMPPSAPEIRRYRPDGSLDPNHYAQGYTARNADSFQGAHDENLFIVFEEMVGIREEFWEAADSMLSSGGQNRWLVVGNPTDSSSFAFTQFLSGDWHVITINAMEHPNIHAELRGLKRPFPSAISVSWIEDKLRSWCRKLEQGEKLDLARDVAWPPLDFCQEKGIAPQWFRPDPRFEGRVLGRWPSTAPDAIWSDALFQLVCKRNEDLHAKSLFHEVQIGCDVARFGSDNTAIHVRQGSVSLYHQSMNGWDTVQIANRLKELCKQFAPIGRQHYWTVKVKIDDGGVGGGVVDQKGEYSFIGVNAASSPLDDENYRLKRDELWFTLQERAKAGNLDLSFLAADELAKLRRQLLGVRYRFTGHGREVEKKEVTKKRIRQSPDDADAINLAYYDINVSATALVGGDREQAMKPQPRRRNR